MKFCWSTLRVKDMQESLKFYKGIVGLTEERRFNAGPETEIVFLGDGETKIELIWDKTNREVNAGKDISWGFEVDSVDDMIKLCQNKGVDIISGPIEPNPHIRFFFVRDPNGLKVQFVENKY